MKKLLLLMTLLLVPALCRAQQTTVAATVTDPSNRAYSFGTGYAAIICPGNQAPLYNGYSVPRTFTITGMNGNGTFTQVLYDVNAITPAGCGYQWHITWSDGLTNFITGTITTVTGASVNLSSTISSYSVALPVSAGTVLSVSGMPPIVSSGGVAPVISCPTCNTSSATIGGSVSNTQVPFGSGSNTVTSSANLEYAPASGGLLLNTANAGPTNVVGSVLAITNSSGTTTSYLVKGSDDSLSLRNDSLATPSHGILNWDSVYDMLLWSGSNGPQLTFYTGNSISPYGSGSAVLRIFKTGSGTHLFSVLADAGAGDAGAITLDPFNGALTFYGDSTGKAAIQVASAAGTPNPIQLPTTTATAAGQVFTSNAANPQQTSWSTIGEYCGATSGGTQACAKTVQTPLVVYGEVALNTATSQSITTLPFADALYSCSGSDLTTAAGVVSFNTYASASVTIVETGGVNTDHLRYVCVGH